MATATNKAALLCPDADSAALVQTESEWYDLTIKDLRDQWEPRLAGMNLSRVATRADADRVASDLDTLYNDVAPEMRKVKAIKEKMEERVRVRTGHHKKTSEAGAPNERATDAILKVAQEGLNDALLTITARYNYVRSVEERILLKKDILRIASSGAPGRFRRPGD